MTQIQRDYYVTTLYVRTIRDMNHRQYFQLICKVQIKYNNLVVLESLCQIVTNLKFT